MFREALVVGINRYSDDNLNDLEKPANDAKAIAELLETKGGFFRPKHCYGKVGFEELQKAISDLFNPDSKALPETALLFFAGHNLAEGFIAASDTHMERKETTAISFQWLAELLQDSPVPQQIIWIDACFSGRFIDLVQLSNTHDRCIITSARAHEEALDQGLLAQKLLESLDYTQRPKDTPWVTNYILESLLKKKNKTAEGWQWFQYQNTGQVIVLTNEAFATETQIDANVCPYKGLHYFDNKPEDARYFKGRDKLTKELLDKVKNTNFLAVLGASGSGKSSVVRAGLLHELQKQRCKILPVITPTAEPLKALGAVIGMPAEQLTDFINQAQTERVVLVIDKFEEVFTSCKEEGTKQAFFDTLLKASERADNKFCLIIVMRSDFFEKCTTDYVDLAHQIQEHQIIVTSMTPDELKQAIVEPIKKVGLEIELRLVANIEADVKDVNKGSLPLLQYTLTEVWKKCVAQRLLTYSAYEKLGKITGTLEQRANDIYEKLSPVEREIAKRIFIELTQLGEKRNPDTRRQLYQQDLENFFLAEARTLVRQVIQNLADEKLLVTDLVIDDKQQRAVVNIVHEALIQHWSKLRDWIDENRDFKRWKDALHKDMQVWVQGGRKKDELLRGVKLSQAEEQTNQRREMLNEEELAFITASAQERKRLSWIKVLLLVVFLVIGVLGWWQWGIAKQRGEIATQRGEMTELRYKGLSYERTEQHQQAFDYYQQALKISQNMSDKKAQANNLSDCGTMYMNLNKPKQALDYFRQALDIRVQLGDSEIVKFEIKNLVSAHGKLGQFKKALDFLTEVEGSRKPVGFIDNLNCSSNAFEFSRDAFELLSGSTTKSRLYFGMSLFHADQLKVIKENCSITVILNNGEIQIINKDNSPYIVLEQPSSLSSGIGARISDWFTHFWKAQELVRVIINR